MTLNKKNYRWIPTVHRLLSYVKVYSKRETTGVLLRFITTTITLLHYYNHYYNYFIKQEKKSEEIPLYLKHDI